MKRAVSSRQSAVGSAEAGADIASSAMAANENAGAESVAASPAADPALPEGGDGRTAAPGPLIPEECRELVEELLVAGLAVEDIAEAVAAQGGPPLTDGAILAHFRTHAHLQKERIAETAAGAAKLREALGNPEADDGLVQLANSALMVGYMGLTKKRSNSITIKDAECIRLTRENHKIRRRLLRLQEAGQKRENTLASKKLRYEDVKYDTALEKLKLLRKQFRLLMEEGKLDPATLDKIREIYGIIRQPFIPDITEEAPAQV